MLNQPRTIPYTFKVFEHEGIVWLYDDSSRDYPCTSEPHIFAEPMYNHDMDEELQVEGSYFTEDMLGVTHTVKGMYPVDMSREEAWNTAREEVQANHPF